jgi:hypothetical protein
MEAAEASINTASQEALVLHVESRLCTVDAKTHNFQAHRFSLFYAMIFAEEH